MAKRESKSDGVALGIEDDGDWSLKNEKGEDEVAKERERKREKRRERKGQPIGIFLPSFLQPFWGLHLALDKWEYI